MAINFSNLVLRPCMNTFARDIKIDPVKSRPSGVPYDAVGIFTSRQLDVISTDGAVLSDQQTTLGIRFADFTGPVPKARDVLIIDDNKYLIDDVAEDGQGGATLRIRKMKPDYPL